MARVVSFAKTIRNHWKKSLFATGLATYGVQYGHEKYEIRRLMRKYCLEATEYGNKPLPVKSRPKTILVLINPTANKRSAQQTYDDYCAPILHCAGYAVDEVKTDSEGHARRYIEELETLPDAILIAGGDGTLSEAVTGLFRRPQFTDCPIGVLPVGRTNTFARQIFNFTNDSNLAHVQGLADASIAVVRETTSNRDVIKIEPIADPNSGETPARPIYALGTIQWGAYRDALNLRDKYWYTGPIREYSTFLFNAFSNGLTWNCSSKLTYSAPCAGCSNCYAKLQLAMPVQNTNRRWWSSVPKTATYGPDNSKVPANPACRANEVAEVESSEVLLSHNANRTDSELPHLVMQFGAEQPSSLDFLWQSWVRVWSGEFVPAHQKEVRCVEIRPEPQVLFSDENEVFFSIDNEAYEVKPIRISIVPRALRLFTL